MKKIPILLAIALIAVYTLAVASPKNVIVLVKGKVIDEKGSPVASNIKIIDKSGKTYNLKSNSSEGDFQQPLPAGTDYDVVFEKYCFTGSEKILKIAPYSEYVEIEKTFKVKPIEKGDTLDKISIFAPNDSIPGEGFGAVLSYLRESMKLNKGLYLNVIISTADSKFSNTKEKQEVIIKKRKKTKTVTITAKENAQRLYEARERNLRTQLENLKMNMNNISIQSDIVVISASKTRSKKSSSKKNREPEQELNSQPVDNVFIIVNKFMKL